MAVTGKNAGQRFTELRHQYAQGLPDRISEINASWDRLQHVSWDPKALTFMAHCAHKLTGSGATFQFPQISTDARALERLLQALLTKPDADAAERCQVSEALSTLTRSVEQAVDANTFPDESATSLHNEQDDNRRYRIAVIEDDPSQATHLQAWLQQLGYTAETFDAPQSYTERAQDTIYHLILLDISFPQGALEGIAWLERLKSQVGSDTPVIMMSARSDMVARMRALRAGADVYLTKPLDLAFLAKRIPQLLEHKAAVRPRVLWVDDDADLLAYYKTLLTDEGYQVDCLAQPVRILERIEQFRPDAIVLDYEMPGCNGIELAQVLRQDARYMTIPILFVSASPDIPAQLEQHSIVGNALFTKPLDNKQFLHSLHQHIVKAQLMAARINLVSQRRETEGLQNQDFFLAELATLLASVESNPPNTASYLAQVCIDQEEYLKARHGVRAMANLTATMASDLAQLLVPNNAGCAIGGGSFLLQINARPGDEGKKVIEALYHTLSTQAWTPEDSTTPVTLSMGVLSLTHSLDVDQALIRVEEACARAIKAGGDRLYWQQTPERQTDTALDDRIKELLLSRAFRLHYQPIVNMENNETMFEALIRLVDDDQAVYMPGQFLQWLPAGAKGPFYELDRWVIEHAVEGLVSLEGKAAASHSVIVKLSSSLADVESLLPFISNVIRNSRIKGKRRIYFALSNPTVVKDVPRAKKILKIIQDMDCGLIIEHVNINSASVELLKELKTVDFVKLTPELGASSVQNQALDGLLNQLNGVFNSSQPIIVTGVEDARVLARFWERGIRYFQGYFIQQPAIAMNYEVPMAQN